MKKQIWKINMKNKYEKTNMKKQIWKKQIWKTNMKNKFKKNMKKMYLKSFNEKIPHHYCYTLFSFVFLDFSLYLPFFVYLFSFCHRYA